MTHRPLRIAHVTATFPPYYGGTGNVCYHNARVLAARGHDVQVFTADWPGKVDDPPGVTVHRLRRFGGVGNAPLLPGLLRLGRHDVVHLHFPFYGGGELVALGRRPYVVTYHQDVLIDGWRGRITGAHDRLVGRRVLAHAARICPTTLDYARSSAIADLVARFGDRVVPIPNGVDTAFFCPGLPDSSVRARHDLAETMPLLLFVGSMDRAHHFKGIPTLLRALTRRPEVGALLVGEGELRAEYERMAAALGLGNRVRFTGRVAAEDLPAYYRTADFVALTSETMGEAFGMVLLEAMASGRPVLATDLPGVRSVVSPGVDGFLAPVADPDGLAARIGDLVALDPTGRAAMGAAGRQKAETCYDWLRIGGRLEGLYREVLAEPRNGRRSKSSSPGPPRATAASDLPIEVRVGLDLLVSKVGTPTGVVPGRAIGDARLVAELRRYATGDGSPERLLALAVDHPTLRAEVRAAAPREVLVLAEGPLARLVAPLRTRHPAVPLPTDLPRSTWRELGYTRIAATGIQGLGPVAWAAGERIWRRLGRPDLAACCRIAMLRTLVAARPAALGTVRLCTYRRTGS